MQALQWISAVKLKTNMVHKYGYKNFPKKNVKIDRTEQMSMQSKCKFRQTLWLEFPRGKSEQISLASFKVNPEPPSSP